MSAAVAHLFETPQSPGSPVMVERMQSPSHQAFEGASIRRDFPRCSSLDGASQESETFDAVDQYQFPMDKLFALELANRQNDEMMQRTSSGKFASKHVVKTVEESRPSSKTRASKPVDRNAGASGKNVERTRKRQLEFSGKSRKRVRSSFPSDRSRPKLDPSSELNGKHRGFEPSKSDHNSWLNKSIKDRSPGTHPQKHANKLIQTTLKTGKLQRPVPQLNQQDWNLVSAYQSQLDVDPATTTSDIQSKKSRLPVSPFMDLSPAKSILDTGRVVTPTALPSTEYLGGTNKKTFADRRELQDVTATFTGTVSDNKSVQQPLRK